MSRPPPGPRLRAGLAWLALEAYIPLRGVTWGGSSTSLRGTLVLGPRLRRPCSLQAPGLLALGFRLPPSHPRCVHPIPAPHSPCHTPAGT